MSKKRFSNRLPKLQRSTRPRWLRAVSKLLASHSPELVIDSTPQEVVAIVAVVVEAIVVVAAAEAVLPEPMSRAIQSLIKKRKRERVASSLYFLEWQAKTCGEREELDGKGKCLMQHIQTQARVTFLSFFVYTSSIVN